jgi:hypothetical protein
MPTRLFTVWLAINKTELCATVRYNYMRAEDTSAAIQRARIAAEDEFKIQGWEMRPRYGGRNIMYIGIVICLFPAIGGIIALISASS